jgi:hypothetical protein
MKKMNYVLKKYLLHSSMIIDMPQSGSIEELRFTLGRLDNSTQEIITTPTARLDVPYDEFELSVDDPITAQFGHIFKFEISPKILTLDKILLNVDLPELPDGMRWRHDVGFRLIKSATFIVGGSVVNKTYSHKLLIDYLLQNPNAMQQVSKTVGYDPFNIESRYWTKLKLSIPIQIGTDEYNGYFVKAIYHEYRMHIELADISDLVIKNSNTIPILDLVINLKYIGQEPQNHQDSLHLLYHVRETLFIQTQKQEFMVSGDNYTVNLHFNLWMRHLLFVVLDENNNYIDCLKYVEMKIGSINYNKYTNKQMRCDNYGKIYPIDPFYLFLLDTVDINEITMSPDKVYFNKYHNKLLLNMSRIDRVYIKFAFNKLIVNKYKLIVYGTNENLMRSMSGMHGLAFSSL